MSDKEYRNTLRQFPAKTEVQSNEVSQTKCSDEEYRSALRSMSKPKE